MTEDKEISLLDSNILIYSIDKDENTKHRIAKKIMERCWKKEKTSCLSVQNLSEFYVNSTKFIKTPISDHYANLIVEDIINFPYFKILEINPSTIIRATRISSDSKVSYWDALIAAVMQENGINTIITENEKDFKKIPSLTVINPFKK